MLYKTIKRKLTKNQVIAIIQKLTEKVPRGQSAAKLFVCNESQSS